MKKTNIVVPIAALSLVACGSNGQSSHPEWCGQRVIYEMNIRQYTPEGTIAAAESHLPRLAEMGVDLIWVMPIQTIGTKDRKGSLGSYYSIKDYYEVNPELGTLADMRSFVEKAHSLGQRVILDWVANHTSRDAVWLDAHPEWYRCDSLGVPEAPHGWDDVAQLDYDNHNLRQAMIEAMDYWIGEAGFDGMRCDVAWCVPTDFWQQALAELKGRHKGLFFLAESEMPEHHTAGFDMTFDWKLHHLFNDIAAGKASATDLKNQIAADLKEFPEGAIRMQFTSNHDENSWAGTERERLGRADKTFAALTYLLEGMPLIYSGQEVGFDRRLPFFEKDAVDWVDRDNYTDFYSALNNLRHSHAALSSLNYNSFEVAVESADSTAVFAAARRSGDDLVVGLFNLSDRTVNVEADLGNNQPLKDYFGDREVAPNQKFIATFEPWQFVVLTL